MARSYQRYVQTLADFAVWLIKEGFSVVLFPTQVRADPPVIKDITELVKDRLPSLDGDSLSAPRVSTFAELLATIARTDLVLASRYH